MAHPLLFAPTGCPALDDDLTQIVRIHGQLRRHAPKVVPAEAVTEALSQIALLLDGYLSRWEKYLAERGATTDELEASRRHHHQLLGRYVKLCEAVSLGHQHIVHELMEFLERGLVHPVFPFTA